MESISKQTKNLQFWTFLIAVMLVIAVLITFIDLSIKTQILTEALNLRGILDEQRIAGSGIPGTDSDDSVSGDISGIVLDSNAAGMETQSSANGTKKPAAKTTRRRNTDNSAANGDS